APRGGRNEAQRPAASSSPPGSTHLTMYASPTPGGRPYAVRFECPASKVTTSPDGARSPSSAAGPPRHVHRHHGAELGATLLEDAWVDANKVLLVDSNPKAAPAATPPLCGSSIRTAGCLLP